MCAERKATWNNFYDWEILQTLHGRSSKISKFSTVKEVERTFREATAG
jgi:hypothetical protein